MLLAKLLLFLAYIIPLIGLIVAYYFAIYLPAKLENDEQIYLQANLKVGDRVATLGGLIGTVFQKTENVVLLTLFDGTTTEVELESISKKF